MHNFTIRLGEEAEEYGIEVEGKSEYGTSTECPLCRSKKHNSQRKTLQVSRLHVRGTQGYGRRLEYRLPPRR
jgi:transposase